MNKIYSLLEFINNENDYYKKIVSNNSIASTEISGYPVLTRKELQCNKQEMISNNYKSKFYYNRLKRQKSSGTSGIPITVFWDYNDYQISVLSLWRRRLKYYRIKPTDKCISFTLNAFDTVMNDNQYLFYKKSENLLLINISLIHNDNSFEKILKKINEFQPKWMYIQPYVLNKIYQIYLMKNELPPNSLKYIESVGEILQSDLKQKVKEYFNIDVANMYGSEEMNGIAYECPHGIMHILEENVFVECKKDEKIQTNGIGEAIITSLTNKAMPLIRYNQGDIIQLEENFKCKCGCCSPIIKNIKGRSLNSLLLKNNYELNAFTLLEIISEANNILNNIIIEYKYVFTISLKKLTCFIKLHNDNKNWINISKKTINEIFLKKTTINDLITFSVEELIQEHDYHRKNDILLIIN